MYHIYDFLAKPVKSSFIVVFLDNYSDYAVFPRSKNPLMVAEPHAHA